VDEARVANDYESGKTELCERVQLTLLSCAGPWRERIYLAGGLVPRYLVPNLPEGTRPHVGTTDVDFVIGIAIDGDDGDEPYQTLETNIRRVGFRPCADEMGQPQSFRWQIEVDGIPVIVEFMSLDAAPGRIVRPKKHTGKLGAFNTKGASLVARDYVVVPIKGRLVNGDHSFTDMRVAGLTSFLTLKTYAVDERAKLKDAYDIVFTLSNWPGGPEAAAQVVSNSTIINEVEVKAALQLLLEHFERREMDGPGNYSAFLADPDVDDDDDLRRLQAVEVVRIFHSHLT
jgi:hypothetical protein